MADDGDRNTIPDSIKLIAGRTGQEFNQRKKRKGAFWEDRYHATAIESGEHLMRCIVYIDLNMVRAGAVNHPCEWPFGGFNEIQTPKRKKILIHYDRLKQLLGFDSYYDVRDNHKKWVEACMQNQMNVRDAQWTGSLAVGSGYFIDTIKKKMGLAAKWRKRLEDRESCQLRENSTPYGDVFMAENGDIGGQNAYYWK